MVGTLFVLNTETTIGTVDIIVNDPSEWLVLPVDSEKRICNSFDVCLCPFYECLFTRVVMWLPLSKFEVVFVKHLKIVPSQIHLRS